MKRAIQITIIFLLLISAASTYLTHWSEATIAVNEDLIRNERVAQDVNIYAAPEILRPGDGIEPMFNKLYSQSDVINSETICKDLKQSSLTTLNRLPVRCFCRNFQNAFIKQVPPLPGYIFTLKEVKRKIIITEIFDGSGNPVNEAEIYFNPMVTFKIDAEGEVEEQVRQTLMLNHSNLETDVVKMSVVLENGRINEPWFQGTDWIRLGSAIIETSKKIVGFGGENFQGATSLPEQFCKVVFLDAKNPPPPKSSLSSNLNQEDTGFWEKVSGKFERIQNIYIFLKRRILSAFLAEALLLKFGKDEIILKSLNVTNYGVEMTENSGKLNHAEQQKETIRGLKTAGQAFFNRGMEQMTPIEQASLAIAPNEPLILKILQKSPEKRTLKDRERLSKQTCKYLKRIKNALVRYSETMEDEGQFEKATIYKTEVQKIPEVLGCSISEAEMIEKAEEFRKLLPSLQINEDDQMSSESLQLLERQNLRNEFAAYIKQSNVSYTHLKDLKVTVVASTKRSLQKEISKNIESETIEIKKTFDKLLSSKTAPFKFDIMVETFISDQIGRVLAAGSVRSEKGRVIPNRQYLNYPAFLGSTAKVINNTAALDSGKITLETVVCSSDAKSPNDYAFDNIPANECMTVGEGLQQSVNWVQIVIRNIVGNEFALKAWKNATNQAVEFPQGFEKWSGRDRDRWLYEQTRGLNAEPVSKSVLQAVEIFTTMANDGIRSKPSFIRKIWVGSELFEPQIEQSQVFSPASVIEVSALLQTNGKTAFGLGEDSPAVKTGSLLNAYWNVVWSRNLVLISRVVILMPKDEVLNINLKETQKKLDILKETLSEKSLEFQTVYREKLEILDKIQKQQDVFYGNLKEKSKAILAREMIQPLNKKTVEYLYGKEKELFKEPNSK